MAPRDPADGRLAFGRVGGRTGAAQVKVKVRAVVVQNGRLLVSLASDARVSSIFCFLGDASATANRSPTR